MQWPEIFPTDCPSHKCQPASGIVYRLVNNAPPTKEDFKSYFEIHNQAAPNVDLCTSCGTSVFLNLEDIHRLQRIVKSQKNKKISRGELSPEFGMIQKTCSKFGSSHRTWWIPMGVEPWNCFEIVES